MRSSAQRSDLRHPSLPPSQKRKKKWQEVIQLSWSNVMNSRRWLPNVRSTDLDRKRKRREKQDLESLVLLLSRKCRHLCELASAAVHFHPKFFLSDMLSAEDQRRQTRVITAPELLVSPHSYFRLIIWKQQHIRLIKYCWIPFKLFFFFPLFWRWSQLPRRVVGNDLKI